MGRGIGNIVSTMTEEELREARNTMLIDDSVRLRLPVLGEYACQAPPNCVPMYREYVRYGLRGPYTGVISEILFGWGIFPTLLIPNSWRLIMSVLGMLGYWGIEYNFEYFTELFCLKRCREGGSTAGWYNIQGVLGDGGLFRYKETLDKKWKEKYFFVEFLKPEGDRRTTSLLGLLSATVDPATLLLLLGLSASPLPLASIVTYSNSSSNNL